MNKYEKIALDIEQQIIDLKYEQGDKLPSIYNLSQLYHCSKSTVIKAYEVLINKHLIYVKHQSGFYVADNGIKPDFTNDDYPLNTGNPFEIGRAHV